MRAVLIPLALAAPLAACAPALPDREHVFASPPVRDASRETITRSRTAHVAVPADALLSWIIDVPLEDVFGRYGTIPAVAGTQPLSDDWPDAGARRRVLLADGHQAAEIILAADGTASFTYQVWGFTNLAGSLADYAIGRFEVAPAESGAQLTWTYAFAPRSNWTRLPLSAFVATQWSGYMTAAVANIAQGAERDLAPLR